MSPWDKNFAFASKRTPANFLFKDSSIEITTDGPDVDIPNFSAAEFVNNDVNVEVIGLNGTILIGNQEFFPEQYHFHSPSEHHINDEYYPLELHLVSEADG